MPQHELQRLLPRHYRILELCLLGESYNDIAAKVGMTPTAIGLIANSPRFQDELARRRGDQESIVDDVKSSSLVAARGILESGATAAAQTLVDLTELSDDERVRQTSAIAILDRVLASKVGTERPVVMIDASKAGIIQLALSESGRGEL